MKRHLQSLFPIGFPVGREVGRAAVSSRPIPTRNGALLGLLLAVGCGTTATSSPTTYHDYQLQLNQIGCEARYRCCGTQCASTADQTFNLSMVSTQKLIDADIPDMVKGEAEYRITSKLVGWAAGSSSCPQVARMRRISSRMRRDPPPSRYTNLMPGP